ncbi:helix-turn-helix domain-containing protein, partial [Oscillochloris sp. ZM17-4]|uniref:helix-turn-helix domain-containing protein n=1 Tax=Oscillochloris sp. ZM17-4 TaxID=2866714 RepID=UPI001C732534
QRRQHTMSVADFAAWLGLSQDFYERLICGDAELSDDRRLAIADKLDLSPERREAWFGPWPPVMTPERQAHIAAIIAEANEQGWICVDPDTFEPTGELMFMNRISDGTGGWREEVTIRPAEDT